MNTSDAESSNTALTQEERRHHERYTVQVPIEIHKEGNSTPMRLATTDISRGGCYVQMIEQFPLGVRVRATLWLDDYPVVVHGLVVTRHQQFGNGIMFMEFEGEGERILIRYVEAVAASA
jgi:hypothetical protein